GTPSGNGSGWSSEAATTPAKSRASQMGEAGCRTCRSSRTRTGSPITRSGLCSPSTRWWCRQRCGTWSATTSPISNHEEPMNDEITPQQFAESIAAVRAEVGKIIVGQRDLVDTVLIGALCEGHVLLECVPGLGKTKLLATLGTVLDVEFGRIQFTPDRMPADILGTNVLQRDEFVFHEGPLCYGHVLLEAVPCIVKFNCLPMLGKVLDVEFGRIQFPPDLMSADILGTNVLQRDEFVFPEGPVFSNLLLADEINRATPKTQ